MCDITTPVSFDAVPDIHGCPCLPTEVGVDGVSIPLGSPDNVEITAGMLTVSQPMCDISQLPVSFDAVPGREGCPRMPREVGVDIVSILLGTPENMAIASRIVKISQSMTDMSQFPVSIDAIPGV